MTVSVTVFTHIAGTWFHLNLYLLNYHSYIVRSGISDSVIMAMHFVQKSVDCEKLISVIFLFVTEHKI